MTLRTIRGSILWNCLHFAIILGSAAIVVIPAVRHVRGFMMSFGLILVPLFFLACILAVRQDGTGQHSLGEIHRQVKRGRRLPKSSLTLAAAVALMVAAMFMTTGPG
jgi:uncharacterized membrane protein YidH (DUF202 family)